MKKIIGLLLLCTATVGFAQVAKIQPKHIESLVYPPAARANRIGGTVTLRVRISASGTVESVDKVNGHPMLRTAAEENIRSWSFFPRKHESTFDISYDFGLPDSAEKPDTVPPTRVVFDLPNKVRVTSAGPYVEAIE